MIIAGHDYKFAYTVSAYLALADLEVDQQRNKWLDRHLIRMALIMSKAYEDRQKLLDPSYEPHYLTQEIIDALSLKDLQMLEIEVMQTYDAERLVTVPAEDSSEKKTDEK